MQIYGQTKLCRRCKRWQQLYIAEGSSEGGPAKGAWRGRKVRCRTKSKSAPRCSIEMIKFPRWKNVLTILLAIIMVFFKAIF